jgi:transcription elongation factor GreB
MPFRRRGSGPKSNYITREGFERIRREAEELWTVERPRVTQEVADAAAQGDRSENAEYIYGKKRLREIDGRLHYLGKRLEQLVVVDPVDTDGSIRFGARVELEDEDGKVVSYRIVGPDEFDLNKGEISMDAPVATALIGKRAGDDVVVVRPKGRTEYVVLSVSYP